MTSEQIRLTPAQSESAVQVLARLTYLMIEKNKWNRTCLDCKDFDERGGEICRKWGVRPPARTLVMGCDAWDNIPF